MLQSLRRASSTAQRHTERIGSALSRPPPLSAAPWLGIERARRRQLLHGGLDLAVQPERAQPALSLPHG
jgi:hypothetical protein